MTTYGIPDKPLCNCVLDTVTILTLLYVLTVANNEPFSGFYMVLALLTFFLAVPIFNRLQLYQKLHVDRTLSHVYDIVLGWGAVAGIVLLIAYNTRLSDHYSSRVVMLWLIATPVALLADHAAVSRIFARLHEQGLCRSLVMVGMNDLSLTLVRRIEKSPHLLMQVQGFFEDRSPARSRAVVPEPLLGTTKDVAAYVRKYHISMVVISLPMSAQERTAKLVNALKDTTASVYFLPDIQSFDPIQARVSRIGEMPVIAICETPFQGSSGILKRATDIVLASLIQFAVTPLMVVIAIAIKLTSPGPVIFKQRRYGLNGEPIIIYKFRSMTVCEDGDQITQAKRNDSRLTKLGAFLRRTSLDELPQFINVLQGRMSIVGPRPHATAHNELYRTQIKGYMLRHKVRPGITGLAQVSGCRGETDTLDKMEMRIHYDLEYLRTWSLWLDLKIILRTIKVAFFSNDAY